ncbi:GNAT family N-acetyltransferase [Microbacterium paludicola]|uniref:GNAT family N-acetyltransferase n=1 Tax=Microbacterium paludicola TaxID=300019 RepID=UPI0011A22E54|nr:GNAT family N-acetyltransferase [Microbacterium paludicola]
MSLGVRRVRADEGARVKALRLEAVADPDAAIAFLSTPEQEAAHDDTFWDDRAANSARGDDVAQFIAENGDEWVGTVTVLRRPSGSTDHHGHVVSTTRADIVGVYVRPSERGSGVIDALFETAVGWAADLGDSTVSLDVHTDNLRAQAAYRRLGFIDDGRRFTGSIGPEMGMARELTAQRGRIS